MNFQHTNSCCRVFSVFSKSTATKAEAAIPLTKLTASIITQKQEARLTVGSFKDQKGGTAIQIRPNHHIQAQSIRDETREQTRKTSEDKLEMGPVSKKARLDELHSFDQNSLDAEEQASMTSGIGNVAQEEIQSFSNENCSADMIYLTSDSDDEDDNAVRQTNETKSKDKGTIQQCPFQETANKIALSEESKYGISIHYEVSTSVPDKIIVKCGACSKLIDGGLAKAESSAAAKKMATAGHIANVAHLHDKLLKDLDVEKLNQLEKHGYMNDFEVKCPGKISCRSCFPEFFLDLHNEKGGGLLNKVKQHIASTKHSCRKSSPRIESFFTNNEKND